MKLHVEIQMLRLLVRGEKEIAEGRGIDLDTVLAEADVLFGFFCARSRAL